MSDFYTIKEAKEKAVIPEPFWEFFKDDCVYCSKPVVISKSLTIMKCSNPKCFRRLAKRLDKSLHDLGIKGYGIETLSVYLENFKIDSFIEFLKDPPVDLGNIIDLIHEKNYSYPQLVEFMHIPTLGTTAHRLFSGCDCYEDFKARLTGDAVTAQLFLESFTGGTVSAAQLLDVLNSYEDELTSITELITPVKHVKQSIPIALTGYITKVSSADGRRLTKDQFINALNNLARPCDFEFVKSAAYEKVAYIVADQPSNSAKYNIGLRRNILVTSSDLYNAIKTLNEQHKEALTCQTSI